MCGICGYIDLNEKKDYVHGLLRRMNSTLKHRGPDDEGFYIDTIDKSYGIIGLAHRRLSIIDLSNHGHQPMSNENGTVWIVFNGEIYNFIDLRNKLLSKGHKFISNTDTEVILHLYEDEKEECLKYLVGMFSFAIWDNNEKQLFIARDRLGKKPLYYYTDRNKLIFASEIKAILQCKSLNRSIDPEAFSDYLTFLSVPAPKTIFQNIKKLMPGHYLIWKNGDTVTSEYWDVQFGNFFEEKKINYIKENLLSKLYDCIKSRLISDVPLGSFLSGGFDSSLIVALMSELMDHSFATSSIGFKEENFNELYYARLISKKYRTKHFEYVVKPDIGSLLPKLMWFFDEPFGDASAVPTYYVSKMTRENVTVALSGDGGDELFAGYRRYYFDRMENQLRLIPTFIRKNIIGRLAQYYPKADNLPQFLRAKTLLNNLSLSPEEAYFNSRSCFTNILKKQALHLDVLEKLGNYSSFEVLNKYFRKTTHLDSLSRVQYVDIKTYLADDILFKVDRMSMANSLEVRCPLLDYRLVEFAARIPPNLRLKGYKSKYILKEVVKNKLPGETLKRKKMGFSVPLDHWFRSELREMAYESIFAPNSASEIFFRKDFLHTMWTAHQNRKSNYGTHLWVLLIFELWYKNIYKGEIL